ncbi:hypothetical protein FA95DRAFT_368406 [Auriscalpium vulgare]|uniref:Uncharacterized protein n=1 Tax=Auriscalpium vulgare TaxID=40419 RepID=A0ACB8RIB2_9AGAM|nr:hypothetical protein FA95DRAFT_368406 [Auriscalpium vulgare]
MIDPCTYGMRQINITHDSIQLERRCAFKRCQCPSRHRDPRAPRTSFLGPPFAFFNMAKALRRGLTVIALCCPVVVLPPRLLCGLIGRHKGPGMYKHPTKSCCTL